MKIVLHSDDIHEAIVGYLKEKFGSLEVEFLNITFSKGCRVTSDDTDSCNKAAQATVVIG